MSQEHDDRRRSHGEPDDRDEQEDVIDLDEFGLLGEDEDDDLTTIIVPGEDDLDAELEAESQAALEDKLTLEFTLAELREGQYRLSVLPGFSDLSRAEVEQLREIWPTIPDDQREKIVRDIADISEESFEDDYERFLHVAIDDPNPVIRQLAITGLWLDYSEEFLDKLIHLVHNDESVDVRARAASALSIFAQLYEFDEISEEHGERVRETLFPLAQDHSAPQLVRRRALEAAAIMNTDERLQSLIEEMYEEEDVELQVTAYFAMGRGGGPRWLSTIINGFASDETEIRFEAARAAGYLGEREAVPELSELIRLEEDAEVRQVAIGALGEIGGPQATRALHRLRELEDTTPADLEAVDIALQELALMNDPLFLGDEDEPTRT